MQALLPDIAARCCFQQLRRCFTFESPAQFWQNLKRRVRARLCFLQADDGQLPGPAGLLQRAMERGLHISSLSDLVPGTNRGQAGGIATQQLGYPNSHSDFESLAWVTALESMDLGEFDGVPFTMQRLQNSIHL